MNDHIDPEAFFSYYYLFDDTVCLVMQHKVGILSTKVGLTDAFRYIMVCPEDLLHGSTWEAE